MNHADLRGINLAGANLDGAKLVGAVYDGRTRWPHGFNPAQHGAILVKLWRSERTARRGQ